MQFKRNRRTEIKEMITECTLGYGSAPEGGFIVDEQKLIAKFNSYVSRVGANAYNDGKQAATPKRVENAA